MAYAADHAEFGFPEPRVGLAALGGGGLQCLARSLPTKFAMDLALTGRRVSAAEAKTLGLINDHVPAAELHRKVRDIAPMLESRDAIEGQSAFLERREPNWRSE